MLILTRVINQPPDTVMENAIAPFRDLLKQDAESNPPGTAGWDYLMTVDYTSTRQFLSMYVLIEARKATTTYIYVNLGRRRHLRPLRIYLLHHR